MKLICLGLIVLSFGFLASCATMADVRDARGQGVSKTFSVPFDTVWNAVPEALSSLGLAVAADNKEDGYILAKRGMTAFSWGERVAVFVTKISSNETKVEVVSKKVLATNVAAHEWGPEVLQRIEWLLPKSK